MNWKSPVVRTILFVLIVGAVGVGYLSYREWQRGERIEEEIEALRQEAAKIQLENSDLAQKIMYFDSPDFQEREAKDKLGLKRADEEEILLSGTPTLPEARREVTANTLPAPEDDVPNYRKWWNLFFHD